MKLYVDELPKSCSDCPFYRLDVYVDLDGYEIHDNECFLEDSVLTDICPLQSLADYTKQVRKEVCEEIRKFIQTGVYDMFGLEYLKTSVEVLNYLDQIQGEPNG